MVLSIQTKGDPEIISNTVILYLEFLKLTFDVTIKSNILG